jgi:hypothetical protein
MSELITLGRDLISALAPISGTRATAQLLVRAKTGPVNLPRNAALVPVINRAFREDLTFKVGDGPVQARFKNGIRVADGGPDCEKSWWVVEPGGTVVTAVSLVGGERHNLKRGTKFYFDPIIPGIEPEAELIEDIADGAEPTHFGGLKGAVQFEQLNGTSPTLDLFRSKIGKLPGVVIVWDSSEPADGTTQSTLDRGAARSGTATARFAEKFNLFIISERLDSHHNRAGEGLKLLEDITLELSDRQEIDGRIFSVPGVHIRGRSRVLGDSAQYQAVYVYLLQLSVTTSVQPKDRREFAPWLRVHHQNLTFENDGTGQKVVVDQEIDMTNS